MSGTLSFIVTSADTGIAEKGEFTYTLSSDPDTGTVPDDFGTIENNGRIWTDKSVSVNDGHFDVNLKVLAQEYISSYGTSITQSIAADVLFILDFTGSMTQTGNVVVKDDGTSVSRLQAMVDAANEAIDIITETNANNRIKMFCFCGNSSTCATNTKEIMPLAHYTSSNTSTETKDKYIRLSATSTVSSSSTLLKDGSAFSFSQKTNNGTCTQYGIAAGVKDFIEDINAETDNSIERRPYVIMLTDGEPTLSSKNWYSEDLTQLRTNTITNQSGGDKYELMATGTILTSAIWRDRLAEAYKTYNNSSSDIDVQWFNIGLGIAEPTDPSAANYTSCLLNPYYLVGVNGSNATGSSSVEKIKYYISSADYAPAYTAKDYSADDAYTYINQGDGYVTFANTYTVLMNAFVTLANIIKMGSAEYTIPIVNHEGSGEQSSDVVFTDVIGEGMFVTDITLKPNGAAPVTGDDTDGDGIYTFRGYNTTVTLTEDAGGQQTLVWSLPATEVAMFTFANREDVTNGEYVSAEPTVLTYGVDFSNEIEEGPAYTNAFDSDMVPLTTVSYEIPGDNSYYFDVITDDLHNFVSSTIKTGLDGSTPKTENVTSSAPDSHSYAYTAVGNGTANSSASVAGLLGNNGKATFLSRKRSIEITVEKKWEDIDGNPVTDSSAMPPVTVYLMRSSDGGLTEETAETAHLSYSNGFTQTYTVPIRDGNNNRYTYYVDEDCPDGYYISYVSNPIRANDGTLNVTNRVFPDEGAIAVKKQWQNKIGAEITDKSSLPEVQIQLKRHVTKTVPNTHTVTVTMTGNNGRDTTYTLPVQTVDAGSTITFTVRAYIRRQNTAQGASISLNNSTVSSSYDQDYYYTDPVNQTGRISSNKFYYRETDTQTFTVTDDLNLDYICSATLNTSTITGYDPCQLLNISVTPPDTPVGEPEKYDELYETAVLNNRNEWQKIFDDLVLTEFDSATGATYSYKYFVEEIAVPGYTVSYSDNNTGDGIAGGVIIVTNKSESAIGPLPKTGGDGTAGIAGTGAAVTLTALVMLYGIKLISRRKRKEEIEQTTI